MEERTSAKIESLRWYLRRRVGAWRDEEGRNPVVALEVIAELKSVQELLSSLLGVGVE